jgi:hypothetical protein
MLLLQVADLEAQLALQRKEIELAAATKLGEAEATYSGKLTEVQQLLADYQSQVIELSQVGVQGLGARVQGLKGCC